MPRLDFYTPQDYRKPFVKVTLHEGEVTIGRSVECTVQLSAERVSRKHALIRRTAPEEYQIEDLSRHGTRLNSARLEAPQVLSPGDRIYIEGFIIVFQDDHVAPKDLEQADTRPD